MIRITCVTLGFLLSNPSFAAEPILPAEKQSEVFSFALKTMTQGKASSEDLSMEEASMLRRLSVFLVKNGILPQLNPKLKEYPILVGKNISFDLQGQEVQCFAGAYLKANSLNQWEEGIIQIESCEPEIGTALADHPGFLGRVTLRLTQDGTPISVLTDETEAASPISQSLEQKGDSDQAIQAPDAGAPSAQ